jgi:murein DD-endopeptidase MepM/ murein hydrolase activator NlpD
MRREAYYWEYEEFGDEGYWEDGGPRLSPRDPEVMAWMVGVTMILFLVIVGWLNRSIEVATPAVLAAPLDAIPLAGMPNPEAFAAPYADYTITQGIHGRSYGHAAIDLAAGAGSPVLSPINGVVTGNYTDEHGNTTLVIENEVYQVLLLHGDYTAQAGDTVTIGEQVGAESNHGYTTDMAGNLCLGRAGCGNHTHLNVFDKRLGENVNPINLIDG